jgi:hypothetical protein
MLALAVVLAACLMAGDGGAFAAPAARVLVPSAAGVPAGRTAQRSAVPWRQVGFGWVLAEYWPGSLGVAGRRRAAAAVLYLFDPGGGRYRLYQWPVTNNPPLLMGWSGDKTRALFYSTSGAVEQVVLKTGRLSRIRLPGKAQVIGYTRPRGLGLFGWRAETGARFQLARYRLDGHLAKILVTGSQSVTAIYSPAGKALAAGARHGVWLVSNRGGLIRDLPVPGVTGRCFPSRWWKPAVILASCQVGSSDRSRLWLVPASGRRPVPLTARPRRHGPDPTDIDAWKLRGRLYLQALTSSGSGRILRQEAGGRAVPVTIPRTAGFNWILTAAGSRLLLSASTPNYNSSSLLWFNPVTRHEHTLIKAPRDRAGVLGAVPYGQPTAAAAIQVS